MEVWSVGEEGGGGRRTGGGGEDGWKKEGGKGKGEKIESRIMFEGAAFRSRIGFRALRHHSDTNCAHAHNKQFLSFSLFVSVLSFSSLIFSDLLCSSLFFSVLLSSHLRRGCLRWGR